MERLILWRRRGSESQGFILPVLDRTRVNGVGASRRRRPQIIKIAMDTSQEPDIIRGTRNADCPSHPGKERICRR